MVGFWGAQHAESAHAGNHGRTLLLPCLHMCCVALCCLTCTLSVVCSPSFDHHTRKNGAEAPAAALRRLVPVLSCSTAMPEVH